MTVQTLSTVVIDVRVVRIVLDGLLEALERLLGLSLFHVHTGNLDPRLRQRRQELQRLQEILLRAVNVGHQELERAAEIECLCFASIPRDALFDRFIDERECVCVVRGSECFKTPE